MRELRAGPTASAKTRTTGARIVQRAFWSRPKLSPVATELNPDADSRPRESPAPGLRTTTQTPAFRHASASSPRARFDHHADAHLAGVDHADVDAAAGQRAEHACGPRRCASACRRRARTARRCRRRRPPGMPGRCRGPRPASASAPASGRPAGTLNDSSARPGPVRFCTIMSTTMPPAATAWKTARAVARPVRQVEDGDRGPGRCSAARR